MFIFYDDEIEELSEDGFYDFMTDAEDNGELDILDKEVVYQFMLLYIQEHFDKKQMTEFLNALNQNLKDKRECEIKEAFSSIRISKKSYKGTGRKNFFKLCD